MAWRCCLFLSYLISNVMHEGFAAKSFLMPGPKKNLGATRPGRSSRIERRGAARIYVCLGPFSSDDIWLRPPEMQTGRIFVRI